MVTVPVSCVNKLFFKALLCEQNKITRTFAHMRMPSAGTKLMRKNKNFHVGIVLTVHQTFKDLVIQKLITLRTWYMQK